ncbi:1232_t:CDS:2, partial [Scutellospora calospora]
SILLEAMFDLQDSLTHNYNQTRLLHNDAPSINQEYNYTPSIDQIGFEFAFDFLEHGLDSQD